MERDGKWRYTSPTHVVAAFLKAMDELIIEGGVEARFNRYSENNKYLRDSLEKLSIKTYIPSTIQSPIISTFLYPYDGFNFDDFYNYVKERGFVLYPSKLTSVDIFRIGNIGEIYKEDINLLVTIIEELSKER